MRYRLLLVGEEQSLWRAVLQRAIVLHGTVDTVTDEEALQAVALGDYDLVVLDSGAVHDAVEMIACLRAEEPRVPIIVATASPTWQRARQALRAGASDYIRKAMDEETVRTSIKQVLDIGRR